MGQVKYICLEWGSQTRLEATQRGGGGMAPMRGEKKECRGERRRNMHAYKQGTVVSELKNCSST